MKWTELSVRFFLVGREMMFAKMHKGDQMKTNRKREREQKGAKSKKRLGSTNEYQMYVECAPLLPKFSNDECISSLSLFCCCFEKMQNQNNDDMYASE